MSFKLSVDLTAWQEHVDAFMAAEPAVIPVIKGNGYGLGRVFLAEQATRLGAETIAVGVLAEGLELLAHFPGKVGNPGAHLPGKVGNPEAHPAGNVAATAAAAAAQAGRIIRTVARLDVLAEVAASAPELPVVIELDSPMRRHGISWTQLDQLKTLVPQVNSQGIAVHLPPYGDRLGTAQRLLKALAQHGLTPSTLWVSHLTKTELATVRASAPGVKIVPRVGTDLWLGRRSALRASGQVLDVQPVRRREPIGYRQRRAGTSGSVLIVGGGTAHGVGLRSSSGARGFLPRLRSLASDALAATNHPRSAFSWNGTRLRSADVTHMQVSMLLLPDGRTPPQVGDWLPAEVRMTLSTFDTIEFNNPQT